MQSYSTPETTHNRTRCLFHKLPGELRNVIYKLVIDEHFAHHSNSHREILYWEHYPKKGESVVLKGTASEYVPGLEAALIIDQILWREIHDMRIASSELVFAPGKRLVSSSNPSFFGRLFRQRPIEYPNLIEDVDSRDLENARALKWLILKESRVLSWKSARDRNKTEEAFERSMREYAQIASSFQFPREKIEVDYMRYFWVEGLGIFLIGQKAYWAPLKMPIQGGTKWESFKRIKPERLRRLL